MTCHSKQVFKLIILCLGVCLGNLTAQTILTGASSYYDDSAVEWTIFGVDTNTVEPEEIEGTLSIKWILRNDFSEWTFDYNNEFTNVKMKFDDFSRWELRTEYNEIVDIKTRWRNDITEWKISYDGITYLWKAEYKNDLNSWFFETENAGYFDMYTQYENDTRDWGIEDQTNGIPDCVKHAAIFITIYCTTPKQ